MRESGEAHYWTKGGKTHHYGSKEVLSRVYGDGRPLMKAGENVAEFWVSVKIARWLRGTVVISPDWLDSRGWKGSVSRSSLLVHLGGFQ